LDLQQARDDHPFIPLLACEIGIDEERLTFFVTRQPFFVSLSEPLPVSATESLRKYGGLRPREGCPFTGLHIALLAAVAEDI
jgi:hypothetical protein